MFCHSNPSPRSIAQIPCSPLPPCPRSIAQIPCSPLPPPQPFSPWRRRPRSPSRSPLAWRRRSRSPFRSPLSRQPWKDKRGRPGPQGMVTLDILCLACFLKVLNEAEADVSGYVRFHAEFDAHLTKGLTMLLVLGLSSAPAGHGCHDAHIAMVLGIARILKDQEHLLKVLNLHHIDLLVLDGSINLRLLLVVL